MGGFSSAKAADVLSAVASARIEGRAVRMFASVWRDASLVPHDRGRRAAGVAGRIRTTAHTQLGKINAENLRKAQALLESGRAQGKVVLAGF
jgi:hypothetical protein